jgi:phospholipid-binding lipoprotein MlaA
MTHKIFLFHRVLFPAIIGSLILLSGCSAIPEKQAGETPAQHPVDSVVREDISYPIDVYDPWEGFNRGMYRFNAGFDRYVFLPVVGAYAAVMPDPVEDSISNFFNNLFEITNLSNSILQLDAEDSINTTWRIIINTTFGLAGLFDVATEMGIHENDEDFGQTLGHYGAGDGPYIVLPVLGPSNLRDTTGIVVDSLVFAEIDPLNLDDHSDREIAFHLLNAIDRRHRTGFRYYDTGSPFEYELVRMLYTRKRELDIAR